MKVSYENRQKLVPSGSDVARWTNDDVELAEWLLSRSFELEVRLPFVASLKNSLDDLVWLDRELHDRTPRH